MSTPLDVLETSDVCKGKLREMYVYVQFHVNARCNKNAKLYFYSLCSLNFLSHWVRSAMENSVHS